MLFEFIAYFWASSILDHRHSPCPCSIFQDSCIPSQCHLQDWKWLPDILLYLAPVSFISVKVAFSSFLLLQSTSKNQTDLIISRHFTTKIYSNQIQSWTIYYLPDLLGLSELFPSSSWIIFFQGWAFINNIQNIKTPNKYMKIVW